MGLIKIGQKIQAGEVTLLNKLNISPFSYGLVISEIFDDGAFFSAKVLDIDEEYIAEKFSVASRAVAALSSHHPTAASVLTLLPTPSRLALPSLSVSRTTRSTRLMSTKLRFNNPGLYLVST